MVSNQHVIAVRTGMTLIALGVPFVGVFCLQLLAVAGLGLPLAIVWLLALIRSLVRTFQSSPQLGGWTAVLLGTSYVALFTFVILSIQNYYFLRSHGWTEADSLITYAGEKLTRFLADPNLFQVSLVLFAVGVGSLSTVWMRIWRELRDSTE